MAGDCSTESCNGLAWNGVGSQSNVQTNNIVSLVNKVELLFYNPFSPILHQLCLSLFIVPISFSYARFAFSHSLLLRSFVRLLAKKVCGI